MIQIENILLSVVITCFATVLLVGLLKGVAPALGLLDRPGGRKHHHLPTPLIGGVAMALALGVCWALVPAVRPHWSIWLGFVMLVALGVADDRRPLSPRFKLGVQALAGFLVVSYAGLSLPDVGLLAPGWEPKFGWFAAPLAIFAILSVINGINMSDGVDGLAGSLSLNAVLALGVAAFLAGGLREGSVIVMLGVALAGFLVFNLPLPGGRSARIFMGDAGSLAVGFLIACFALWVTDPAGLGVPHAVALWACALPLLDGLNVIIRRLLRGEDATQPGRDHLHHLLLARGLAVPTVLAIEVGLGFLFAALALLAWQLGVAEWLISYAFIVAAVAYHLLQKGLLREIVMPSVPANWHVSIVEQDTEMLSDRAVSAVAVVTTESKSDRIVA
jgi:UDP-GlcNAc:undecaprenyl-phosphate GlcNAc-1-phosphate transferase